MVGMRGQGSPSCSDAVVLAAHRGEEKAVLEWLDGGGRADATYERDGVSGLTLLLGAALYGHLAVVELLLQHGAEVNLQSSDGSTACLLYTSPSPRDRSLSRMPSSA